MFPYSQSGVHSAPSWRLQYPAQTEDLKELSSCLHQPTHTEKLELLSKLSYTEFSFQIREKLSQSYIYQPKHSRQIKYFPEWFVLTYTYGTTFQTYVRQEEELFNVVHDDLFIQLS